jgi:DNA-binding transcriptional MocR family regulator
MTTTQIADSLNISKPTALRTMTELKALGLVEMIEGDSNAPATITLVQQFNWIFDKEFLHLREGFVPSDNSEHMLMKRKEKSPLTDEKNETNDSPEAQSEAVDGSGDEIGPGQ